MTSESREIHALRSMNWELAKGHLKAILSMTWNKEIYDDLEPRINNFLEMMENESALA